MELRPYQQQLVDDAVRLMRERRHPCVTLSTGGGKSVIAAEIVRQAMEQDRPVLAACHRLEIAQHLITSIGAHTGEAVGVITANHTTPLRRVNIAMIPTLVRRKRIIEKLQGCAYFLDECHHHQAKSYQNLFNSLEPSAFCGFTATPVTPTGGGLGKYGFTDLLVGPGYKWLRDNGFLAPYKLYGATGEIDTKGVTVRAGDYAVNELAERVVEVEGSVLRDWRQFNPEGHSTICIGVTVQHAQDLCQLYRAAGVSAEVVDGSTPAAEREAIFARFKAKEVTVLCACAVIEEGTDIPAATCLQLLRPTRSIRLYKQLVGRVLRPQPGKVAIIIDHSGSWRELPLPCEDIEWSLTDKPKLPSTPRELDEEREVIEKPAPIQVQENRFQLTEIDPAYVLGMRLVKRRSKFRSCLAGVRKGILPKTGLWKYANNPAGLSETDKAILEDILNAPRGYCNQQPLALV